MLDEDFSFLQPLDLITKDVYELRQIINEKRKNLQKDRDKDKDKDKELNREHEGERARIRDKERHEREKERHEKEKEREKDKERTEKDKEQEKQHVDHTDRETVADQEDKDNVKPEDNGVFGGKFTLVLNLFPLFVLSFIPAMKYNTLWMCFIGPEPMDISTTSTSQACEIPSSDVIILEGHTSEV